MSNKSSPRSARTKTRPVRGRVAASEQRKKTPPAPETWGDRLRHYLPFVAVPQLVVVLAIIVVCLTSVLVTGARLSYLPGAIGATWLAVHGAALRYDGVTLGAMPILPVVGVVALTASRVRAAVRRRVSVADLVALTVLIVAATLTLAAVSLFMVGDASRVYRIDLPPVLPALLYPVVVQLAGLAVGMGPVLWRALARRYGAPAELVDSALLAWRLVGRLLAAAAVVYLVLLAFGHARIGELLGSYPVLTGSGGTVLGLLSLAYLPNAVVATLGVLLGGSFGYADGSASLFAVDNVPFPPLPLFGAVPGAAAAWAPALMLVPAAVVLHTLVRTRISLFDALTSAAWSALFAFLLALFAGGTAGAYGYVGVNPFALAALAFVWVGLPGTLTVAVAKLRAGRRESAPAGPEEEPGPTHVAADTGTDTGAEAQDEVEAEVVEDEDEPEASEETAETGGDIPETGEETTEAPATTEEPGAESGSTKWVPPETGE
ncbi:DUF6350 family protein [Corynebacterium sp. UBA2622]|uniref:cell division protein PerM n=1 Tax=Corynebacterium sp. UBA2622 TaxID=1946393 RepID=UPI0025BEC536|nr:DUF6350 family protein [Corynebacterium sp. UBA2622]